MSNESEALHLSGLKMLLPVIQPTVYFTNLDLAPIVQNGINAADTADHRMHAERGSVGRDTSDALNGARRAGGRLIAVGSTSLRLIESASAEDGTIHPFDGETAMFITPGYRFRAVDVMLTNFHLPRSTLFMLVAAFCGLEVMQEAYAHAIATGYRFYSYGDACLLFRAQD